MESVQNTDNNKFLTDKRPTASEQLAKKESKHSDKQGGRPSSKRAPKSFAELSDVAKAGKQRKADKSRKTDRPAKSQKVRGMIVSAPELKSGESSASVVGQPPLSQSSSGSTDALASAGIPAKKSNDDAKEHDRGRRSRPLVSKNQTKGEKARRLVGQVPDWTEAQKQAFTENNPGMLPSAIRSPREESHPAITPTGLVVSQSGSGLPVVLPSHTSAHKPVSGFKSSVRVPKKADNTETISNLRNPRIVSSSTGLDGVTRNQLINYTGLVNAATHMSNVSRESAGLSSSENQRETGGRISKAVGDLISRIQSGAYDDKAPAETLNSYVESLKKAANAVKSDNGVESRNGFVALGSILKELSRDYGIRAPKKPRGPQGDQGAFNRSAVSNNRLASDFFSAYQENSRSQGRKNDAGNNLIKAEWQHNENKQTAAQAAADAEAAKQEYAKRQDNVDTYIKNLYNTAGNRVSESRREAVELLAQAGIRISPKASIGQIKNAIKTALSKQGMQVDKGASMWELARKAQEAFRKNEPEDLKGRQMDLARKAALDRLRGNSEGKPVRNGKGTEAPVSEKRPKLGTDRTERTFVNRFRKMSDFLKSNADKIREAREAQETAKGAPSSEDVKFSRQFGKDVKTLRKNSERVSQLKERKERSESSSNIPVSGDESSWASDYDKKSNFVRSNAVKAEKLRKKEREAKPVNTKEDLDFLAGHKSDKKALKVKEQRISQLKARKNRSEASDNRPVSGEDKAWASDYASKQDFLIKNKSAFDRISKKKEEFDKTPQVSKEDSAFAQQYKRDRSYVDKNSGRYRELSEKYLRGEQLTGAEDKFIKTYESRNSGVEKNKDRFDGIMSSQSKAKNKRGLTEKEQGLYDRYRESRKAVSEGRDRYADISGRQSSYVQPLNESEQAEIDSYDALSAKVKENSARASEIEGRKGNKSSGLTAEQKTFLDRFLSAERHVNSEENKGRYADIVGRKSSYVKPLSESEQAEIDSHDALQRSVNERGAKAKEIQSRMDNPVAPLSKEHKDILKAAEEAEAFTGSGENRAKYFGIARKTLNEAKEEAAQSLAPKFQRMEEDSERKKQLLRGLTQATTEMFNAETEARNDYIGEAAQNYSQANDYKEQTAKALEAFAPNVNAAQEAYLAAESDAKRTENVLSGLKKQIKEQKRNKSNLGRDILPDVNAGYSDSEAAERQASHSQQAEDIQSGKSNYNYKTEEQTDYEQFVSENPELAALGETLKSYSHEVNSFKGNDKDGETAHSTSRNISNELKRSKSAVMDMLSSKIAAAESKLENLQKTSKADEPVRDRNGNPIKFKDKDGNEVEQTYSQLLKRHIEGLKTDRDTVSKDKYGTEFDRIVSREMNSANRIRNAVSGNETGTPLGIAEAAEAAKQWLNRQDTDYGKRHGRDISEREIGARTGSKQSSETANIMPTSSSGFEGREDLGFGESSDEEASNRESNARFILKTQDPDENDERTGINTGSSFSDRAKAKEDNRPIKNLENRAEAAKRRDEDGRGPDSSLPALVAAQRSKLEKTNASLADLKAKYDDISKQKEELEKFRESLANDKSDKGDKGGDAKTDSILSEYAYQAAIDNHVKQGLEKFYAKYATDEGRDKLALKRFNVDRYDSLTPAQQKEIDRADAEVRELDPLSSSFKGRMAQTEIARLRKEAISKLNRSDFEVNADNRENLTKAAKDFIDRRIGDLDYRAELLLNGKGKGDEGNHRGRKSIASLESRAEQEKKTLEKHEEKLKNLATPENQESSNKAAMEALGAGKLERLENSSKHFGEQQKTYTQGLEYIGEAKGDDAKTFTAQRAVRATVGEKGSDADFHKASEGDKGAIQIQTVSQHENGVTMPDGGTQWVTPNKEAVLKQVGEKDGKPVYAAFSGTDGVASISKQSPLPEKSERHKELEQKLEGRPALEEPEKPEKPEMPEMPEMPSMKDIRNDLKQSGNIPLDDKGQKQSLKQAVESEYKKAKEQVLNERNKNLEQHKQNLEAYNQDLEAYNQAYEAYKQDADDRAELAKEQKSYEESYQERAEELKRTAKESDDVYKRGLERSEGIKSADLDLGRGERLDGKPKKIIAKLNIESGEFPTDEKGRKQADLKWVLGNLSAIMDESKDNAHARAVVDKYFDDLGIDKATADDLIKRLTYDKQRVAEIAKNPKDNAPLVGLSEPASEPASESGSTARPALPSYYSKTDRGEINKRLLHLPAEISDATKERNAAEREFESWSKQQPNKYKFIEKYADAEKVVSSADDLFELSNTLNNNGLKTESDKISDIAAKLDDNGKLSDSDEKYAINLIRAYKDKFDLVEAEKLNSAEAKKLNSAKDKVDSLKAEKDFLDKRLATATKITKKNADKSIDEIKHLIAEQFKDENAKAYAELEAKTGAKAEIEAEAERTKEPPKSELYSKLIAAREQYDNTKSMLADASDDEKASLKAKLGRDKKRLTEAAMLYAREERDNALKELNDIADGHGTEGEGKGAEHLLSVLANEVSFVRTSDGTSVKPSADADELARDGLIDPSEVRYFKELIEASREQHGPAFIQKMSEETRSAMKTLQEKGRSHNRFIRQQFNSNSENADKLKKIIAEYKQLAGIPENSRTRDDINRMEALRKTANSIRTRGNDDQIYGVSLSEKGRASFYREISGTKSSRTGGPKRDYGYSYVGGRDMVYDQQGGRSALVTSGLRGH